MGETRFGKPDGKVPLDRSRHGEKYLIKSGVVNLDWIKLAQKSM